jgi:DNA-binding beta-propeller fold protein YncE
VTVVDARDDQVRDVIPVPGNAVSVVADIQLATLYVLQPDGQVNALGIADGRVMARFPVGTSGLALALSPDGSTLYALKGTQTVANVAVVDVATESVRRVIPAPSHCRELLVSASGRQLYEGVGTTGYGNIQVFGV